LTRDRSDAKLDLNFETEKKRGSCADESAPVRVVDVNRLVGHVERDGLREEDTAASAAAAGAARSSGAAAAATAATAATGTRAGAATGVDRRRNLLEEDGR
jgi:hypothetical protein